MTQTLQGAATATVKGGFWAQYGSTVAGYSPGAQRKQANYQFNRRGLLGLKEAMLTLLGATAGSAALKNVTRVEANSELGGKRTIETVALIDENTVSGDVTSITDTVLADIQYDSTPTANKNGNPLGSAGLF